MLAAEHAQTSLGTARDTNPQTTAHSVGQVPVSTSGSEIMSAEEFGQWAKFDRATFNGSVRFFGTQFSFNASFHRAHFSHDAGFVGAQFKEGLSFDDARFCEDASFVAAQFGSNAIFVATKFEKAVDFNGAQFGDGLRFDGAKFGDVAKFNAWSKQRVEGYWRSSMDAAPAASRMKFAAEFELRSDAFKSVSFAGAEFLSDVTFQNREFLATTNFGPVIPNKEVGHFRSRVQTILPCGKRSRFSGVPTFHGCKLHQDTSFDQAQFLSRSSPEAARAYRTLKLAMAQQQAIREEQTFFRLEMLTEAELQTSTRRRLFKSYENLADYGLRKLAKIT